ncbi:MAG: hypothetical protein LBE72_02020 [Rickettsia sp.]|nr:hypothetical protein [Rickettsia sp.]
MAVLSRQDKQEFPTPLPISPLSNSSSIVTTINFWWISNSALHFILEYLVIN